MNNTIAKQSLLDFAFDNLTLSDTNESHMMAEIIMQLTQKRIQMGKSQKEFAELLGVSQGMLSRYETGANNFSVKKIAEIFGKLDISVSLNFSSQDEGNIFNDIPKPSWDYPDFSYIEEVDRPAS